VGSLPRSVQPKSGLSISENSAAKNLMEYFSDHQGDFYSVSVQSVGTLEIGCPSARLTQNCGHANKKGLSDDIDPSHRIGSL
jgi:hypothetical protein